MLSMVWYPKKSHHGYYDKALGWVNSKSHKEKLMKEKGMVEDGSTESDKHRTNRLVDEINYSREKQGLKPKTKVELIGDSREKRR